MRKRIVLLVAMLGLLLRPALGQTELIVNSGFEASVASIAPWQIAANPAAALNALASAGAYGGSSQCLLLGGGNSYTQDVYQIITFPSNLISATLSFYYNVITTDLNNSIDATLYLQFKDASQSVIDQVGLASNRTYTGGYTQFSAQIVSGPGSKYAGKTVTFHFVAATANVFAAYTDFIIDNVSIQIATTADIPANDNFTNATVITGASAVLFANNAYASKETNEPVHAGIAGGHSVWWRWVAPSNGIVAIKATGSSFQPLLAAYTGNTVSQLTQVAANTANPAQISFKAAAGTAYAIAVDGYGETTGGIVLSLGFASDVTAPAVAISTPLAGANVTNAFVPLKGVASDNIAVAQVQFRLENRTGTNDYQTALGTNSWSATVSNLVPGVNTVRVRAIDTSSNYSANVTRIINYLAGSPITLATNGRGNISGATNEQKLNLGYTYLLTALPAVGFAFTNWTDGSHAFVTNKPALTFQMASNLSFIANFVDVQKPTVAITNLPLNGNVSNELFTVRGKAGDNVAVTNVFYNLNHYGWNEASPSNNWNNWFADLDLTPGTNTLSTYAVDSTGNLSLTNTVKFVYVLSAQLTVGTNGQGKITPALNGALLQIGRNFTMTAAPAVGFAFTNWIDGGSTTITNKPALTFLMASNLVFTANFIDIAKPTVSVTNLPVGGNVSNAMFVAKGKAGDNVAVTNVSYNLNHTGWLSSDTTNSWTNWFASLDLMPGTNTLSTYALDSAGNLSATNTARIFYVVSALLTVSTNGRGSIAPALNGALLPIGRNFTLTATPATGFRFTNWTDGDNAVLTNKPTLWFGMASNLTLAANFIDIAKPTLSITNVAPGQHWSNALFTLKGTTTDNFAVTNVSYNLNSNGWNPTDYVPGKTNWSAPINLVPGTNAILAYAVDATGNTSLTNMVKIVYVVSGIVNVQLVGTGTLTPNYNGQSLEIGKAFSMKATAASGFVFSYWSGDVEMTTNTTLAFIVASNMTVIAHFRDVTKPVVAITQPMTNQLWRGQDIVVKGTAADNYGVSNVWVQFNGGGWIEAVTTNNFASWFTTNLTVLAETNLVESFAIDGDGNVSLTNRVKFIGHFPNSGMAPIPVGTYTMGDRLGDYDAYDITDNRPTNIVLSAFLIDTNLVSYSQWQLGYNWATNHGYHFDNAGAGKAMDHPVQTINWYDCAKWCNARSVQGRLTPTFYTDAALTKIYTNGHPGSVYVNWLANGYRLPTEAEYETSARGLLTSQRFPWGDLMVWERANYTAKPLSLVTNGFFYDYAPAVGYDPDFNDGAPPYTGPVGAFIPNGYGLNDMAGNVSEWCWDWYGTPYGKPTTNNPTGPTLGNYRVLRGGSWNATANEARCAYRGKKLPLTTGNDTGFRCVRRE